MSLLNFSNIIDKYPHDRATIERLGEVCCAASTEESATYTLERLSEIAQPSSYEALALILGEFVRKRMLELVIRVESSSSHGGIADYPSLTQVPSRVHDWRTDQMVDVTPENLRVLYQIVKET